MNGEMIRNGFGYVDLTLYQAINDAPKGGEIWTHGSGAEMLILKNHGTICTVIKLTNVSKPESVEVISRQIMYADLRFVQYAFAKDMAQYVKTLPAPEYKAIMGEFAETMGVTIKVQTVEQADEIETLKEANAAQQSTIAKLEEELARQEVKAASNGISEITYKALYEELLDRVLGR